MFSWLCISSDSECIVSIFNKSSFIIIYDILDIFCIFIRMRLHFSQIPTKSAKMNYKRTHVQVIA